MKELSLLHDVVINTCIQTRSYQERCIRLALANGGGVIVAPTGAGKTTMAIELASRLGSVVWCWSIKQHWLTSG